MIGRFVGLLVLVLSAADGVAAGTRVTFSATGDTPYFDLELPRFFDMQREIGATDVDFVLHIGDFKRSRSSCDDAAITQRLTLLSKFGKPLLLTPGDNDWSDCWGPLAGAFDPYGRLQFLRQAFFQRPPQVPGWQVIQQRGADEPDFPENVRIMRGDVMLLTLHVIGHGNRVRGDRGGREHELRDAANLAWLARARRAGETAGVTAAVVAFHADPNLEPVSRDSGRRPYYAYLEAMHEWAKALPNGLLLIHGDTHLYRFNRAPVGADKTGRPYQFHRLEVFGAPFVGYALVTVDTSAEPEAVFEVRPRLMF